MEVLSSSMKSACQNVDDAIFVGNWTRSNFQSLFHELKVYGIGVSDNEVANNARTFCCEAGRFPLKFLGAPVKANMSLKRNWPPIIERIWLNPFLLKLDRARIPFSDSIIGRALISLPWRSICFWSWARRNIALWRRELVEVMWRGLGRDDLITVRNEMSLMKLIGVSA
uniref:Reverse transcriptase zinc-binding domain-containing protein n=1 Tax=Lactuca sativa TaxID=4236 RepID=A0A9R1XMV9_LACSA|nr:hypothetical protein LSAT_V11C300154780 [Lactuca sativa]